MLRQIVMVVVLALMFTAPPTQIAAKTAGPNARSEGSQQSSLARLEPAAGAYFGVNLDWASETAADFNARLGRSAVVYVQFARLPFGAEDLANLESFGGSGRGPAGDRAFDAGTN
jgi:hypothetical protein